MKDISKLIIIIAFTVYFFVCPCSVTQFSNSKFQLVLFLGLKCQYALRQTLSPTYLAFEPTDIIEAMHLNRLRGGKRSSAILWGKGGSGPVGPKYAKQQWGLAEANDAVGSKKKKDRLYGENIGTEGEPLRPPGRREFSDSVGPITCIMFPCALQKGM